MSDKSLALSNYDTLCKLLNKEDVRARFEEALGERSGAFIASLMTIISGNPALMECTPKSILAGAIKAAVIDLPLLPDLGYACLVPFYNSKTKQKEAQFQIMTKGYIQLAHRTKMYQVINTTKIYEGQTVIEDQLTGQIRLEGKRISDKVVGWVNYFRLKNGYEKYFFMTREELHEHGRKYSKSYDSGLWKTDPEIMESKTVTKLNLKRNGILSTTFNDDEDAGEDYFDIDVGKNNSDEFIIDGVIEQPSAPSPSPEPAEQPKSEPIPNPAISAAVETDIVQTPEEAAIIIGKLGLGADVSMEETLKDIRGYIAWKELGANDKKAVEYVKTGQFPK